MPTNEPTMTQELEDAEAGFGRVRAEVEAQDPNDLAPLNVDIVTASSTVIGVSRAVMAFRERAAKLPEFDIRNFDKLNDYAKAAWYLHITNLPVSQASDLAGLVAEVNALRAKLLLWAQPLAASGKLPQAAISVIKDGAGTKNSASDVVSLIALYRSNWDAVRDMCGVTAEDLDRGAKIGPAVFAMVSQRDNQPAPALADSSLRVRQAWTLLDRAYSECRRVIAFFRYNEGDVDSIAPSLRRNPGARAKPEPQPEPVPEPITPVPAVPATPQPSLGGNGSPFAPR